MTVIKKKKKQKKRSVLSEIKNISQTDSWLIATLLKTSTERRWEGANAGGEGGGSLCRASGLGCDRGGEAQPRTRKEV